MVKYGYWYGLPLVLVAGGLIGFKLYIAGALFLILAFLVLNFFRDPERRIPQAPEAVVSPADGRIVQIVDEDAEGRPVRRVSVFMSPLDVHVNRAPIAGTIKEVRYEKGWFGIASRPEASVKNEQNIFTLEGPQGTVVVKQIAGVLARRIVFWKAPGDVVKRGERVGLIKFGSRVDLALPPRTKVLVKVGDHVRAGSTIIAVTQTEAVATRPT